MNKGEYKHPKEDDIIIKNIQMSTRLRNILVRNGITLISQVSNYPKEALLRMRNMGEVSFEELVGICEKFRIKIQTLESLAKDLKPVTFYKSHLLVLYESNIYAAEDIEKFSMNELKKICNYNRGMYNNLCKVIKQKNLNVKIETDNKEF